MSKDTTAGQDSIEDVSVTAQDREGRRVAGEVRRMRVAPAARKAAGLKALGLCWALMVVSVFLPLAHFVLVPLFGVLGPVMYLVKSKEAARILGGSVGCPAFGTETELGEQAESWPLLTNCAGCGLRLTIEEGAM